jgi:hypothetical protein
LYRHPCRRFPTDQPSALSPNGLALEGKRANSNPDLEANIGTIGIEEQDAIDAGTGGSNPRIALAGCFKGRSDLVVSIQVRPNEIGLTGTATEDDPKRFRDGFNCAVVWDLAKDSWRKKQLPPTLGRQRGQRLAGLADTTVADRHRPSGNEPGDLPQVPPTERADTSRSSGEWHHDA